MMNQQSLKEVKEKMIMAVKNSDSLLIKKIGEQNFHLLSKKNYGSLSVIEKEYYNITGKLVQRGTKTESDYKVNPNSTYWIIGVVLPIMFLPTVFIGMVGGNKSNLLSSITIYLVLSAIVIFLTWKQHQKLKKMGEKDFEKILGQLK